MAASVLRIMANHLNKEWTADSCIEVLNQVSEELNLMKTVLNLMKTVSERSDNHTQQHSAPIPVSERLPGPEDCNENGTCWAWNPIHRIWGQYHLNPSFHTHWLSVNNLPLPEENVTAS